MIELPQRPTMADFQRYVHDLEKMHGWLDVDLVHNCFLMGEEVGELFKSIRKYERLWNDQKADVPDDLEARRADVADELVDVLNYLMALANRLDIDLEAAFRNKNRRNQDRTWEAREG